jgi:hypothetical protein
VVSKYLRFVLIADTGKTLVYNVISVNQGSILGRLLWWGSWRQYVFEPAPYTVWNKDCLRELAAYLDNLIAARRVGARQETL